MVNMKTTYKLIFALIFIFAFGCDRDEFANLNSDPSTLSEPDLRYSMTKAIEQMYGNDYTNWFYSNFQYIHPWVQVGSTQGGNGVTYNEMGPAGGQNLYGSLMPQTMDIRARIDALPEEEKAALPEKIDTCIQIIKSFGTIGVARTMNQFNKRK